MNEISVAQNVKNNVATLLDNATVILGNAAKTLDANNFNKAVSLLKDARALV